MVCCENQDTYNKMKSQNTHESIKELKLKDGNLEVQNSVLKEKGEKQELISQKDVKFQEEDYVKKMEKISLSNSDATQMLIEANENPQKDELGSKSINSLEL